jgi:hypothetical protein
MKGSLQPRSQGNGHLPTEAPDQHKNRLISEVRTGISPYSAIYAYAPDDSLLARDLPAGGRGTSRRMEDSSRLRWLFTLAVDVATHRHRSGPSVTRGA